MQKNEVLKNHYTNLLCRMINEKGANARTIEDIFDNLPLLAKKVMHFGEETMYLDLNMKKMLAKALDPEVRIMYRVTENNKNMLAVEAFLYWGNESNYSGYGFSKKNLESLVTSQADAALKEASFEALVKGAAASRALTDAGIGLEFYCDEMDDLLSEMESMEVEERIERKEEKEKESFERKVPQVPSNEERKKKRIAESKKEPKSEKPETTLKEEVPENNLQEDTGMPAVMDEPAQDEIDAVSQIFGPANELEQAKMAVCNSGDYAGQTLGEIAENNMRLLVRFARDPECNVKDQARTIIIADGTYAKYLN